MNQYHAHLSQLIIISFAVGLALTNIQAGVDTNQMSSQGVKTTPYGNAEFVRPNDSELCLNLSGVAIFTTREPTIAGVIVPTDDCLVFTVHIRKDTHAYNTKILVYDYDKKLIRHQIDNGRFDHLHTLDTAKGRIIIESSPANWEEIKHKVAWNKLVRSMRVLDLQSGLQTPIAEIEGEHPIQAKWTLEGDAVLINANVRPYGDTLARWNVADKSLESIIPSEFNASEFEPLPEGRVAAYITSRKAKGLFLLCHGAPPKPVDMSMRTVTDLEYDPKEMKLVVKQIGTETNEVKNKSYTLDEFMSQSLAPVMSPVPATALETVALAKVGDREFLSEPGDQKHRRLVVKASGQPSAVLLDGLDSIRHVSTSPLGDVLFSIEPSDTTNGDARRGWQLHLFRHDSGKIVEVGEHPGHKLPDVRWAADGRSAFVNHHWLDRLDVENGKMETIVRTQVFEYIPLPDGRVAFYAPSYLAPDDTYVKGIFVSNPADPKRPILVKSEVPASNLRYDASTRTLHYEILGPAGEDKKSVTIP